MRLSYTALTTCLMAGCSAEIPVGETPTLSLATPPCAADTGRYDAGPLELNLKAAALGSAADMSELLPPAVKFIEGWHLTSAEGDFGGLSGLEIMPTGDLLAVSDKGYFFTFDPDGKKRPTLMPLYDAVGKSLVGKTKGDAEGLALKDGVAFVSFEREHRILAYPLKACGVAARGLLFAGSPEKLLGTKLRANDGAEALDMTTDGRIRAGYETVIDGRAPLVTFNPDGTAAPPVEFIAVDPDFKLVGADDGFFLFRAYDREAGNRNIIRGPNIEFKLAPPLNVDNFEGIAVQPLETGITRIYLISDDNFSARQRTLLYVFEVTN